MAKKQTRRSVSIRGATYEKVRSHCEKNGQSMSEFVEQLIGGFFAGNGSQPAAQPAARPTRPAPAPARKSSRKAAATAEEKLSIDELHDAARFFTF